MDAQRNFEVVRKNRLITFFAGEQVLFGQVTLLLQRTTKFGGIACLPFDLPALVKEVLGFLSRTILLIGIRGNLSSVQVFR